MVSVIGARVTVASLVKSRIQNQSEVLLYIIRRLYDQHMYTEWC